MSPLIGMTAAFSGGIIFAGVSKFSLSVSVLASLIFLFLAFLFKRKPFFYLLVLLSFFSLGASALKNLQFLPKNHIARLVPYKEEVWVKGIVQSDPFVKNKVLIFILKVEQVAIGRSLYNSSGIILVRDFGTGNFAYGYRLLLRGRLYRPQSGWRDFNYEDFLNKQGIYRILSVKKGNYARVLSVKKGNPLKSFSLKIKHAFAGVFRNHLSKLPAAMLNALILGDRQDLPQGLTGLFMNLGTIHVIAISGFNVGIISFIILVILKIIKIPRKARYLVTIFLLLIYCLLTGASPPVVRATIMASVFLMAYFIRRDVNIFNSCSLAALAILLFNPNQIFQISFQLSFLSLVSIACFFPLIKSIFPERLEKSNLARFVIMTFCASAAAWLGVLPFIAYKFRIFSPVTILANMVIVPFSALITVSGFSLAFIGVFFPFLSGAFASSNELLILLFLRTHQLFAAVPYAFFKLPPLPFFLPVLYYTLLISYFFWARRRKD